MAINKQKALSSAKGFYHKINQLKSYLARARYTEKYYASWYRDIAKLDLGHESALTNPNFPSFFRGSTTQRCIYLVSPSISEIEIFSSRFKKVYFSAIPKLSGTFPSNTKQIYYDKTFELSPSQIKGLEVDCAFSHHVIEHIHPDDLQKHFEQVYSLLKVGGQYLIICPSSIRIKRDEVSTKFDSRLSAYHHIGRYSYLSVYHLAKSIGYSKCSKPIINPNLLNYFYPYNNLWCYDYLEKLSWIVPDSLLSLLGLSSLYIIITK